MPFLCEGSRPCGRPPGSSFRSRDPYRSIRPEHLRVMETKHKAASRAMHTECLVAPSRLHHRGLVSAAFAPGLIQGAIRFVRAGSSCCCPRRRYFTSSPRRSPTPRTFPAGVPCFNASFASAPTAIYTRPTPPSDRRICRGPAKPTVQPLDPPPALASHQLVPPTWNAGTHTLTRRLSWDAGVSIPSHPSRHSFGDLFELIG